MNIFTDIVKASPRNILILSVLIVINVSCIGFRSFYQMPKLIDLQEKWFALRQGGGSKDLITKYQKGISDLQTWEKRISLKQDFVRVVGELFELAANNSLKVNQVTYKPTQMKNERLLAYSINFNVIGRYVGVKKFIADLAKSKEMLVINAISLSNNDNTKESVSLNIQLTTYFRMG